MKKAIFFIAIIKSLFFFNNTAHAQLVSGNIYLQGAWVEVGIAPNGSWGGGTGAGAAPAGYHPAPGFTNIGSMYDWGHDGWTVGTPPYFGDYMLEGTPFEGWSMQVNGARSDAFYTTGSGIGTTFYDQTPGVSSLLGSNISYSNAGGMITGVWHGATTGTSGGLDISQTTTLDTLAPWVINRVVFKNTSAAAIPGVYYWRTFDPDGDESWSGNFATNNEVVYQNDALHRVMVASTGMSYSHAYLSLGAKDCRAVCMVYVTWAPYPAYGAGNSLDKVWAGTATGIAPDDYTAGSSDNGDYAIGIIFNLGTIAAGDSAVFSYAYIYDGNIGIDSAFPESVITGPTSFCVGSTITLSDPAIGGIWSSSNPSIATIAPYTGVVSGSAAGSVTITYALDPATCRGAVTYTVTVTNGISPITGPSSLCAGTTANFSDGTAGGTWSVTNTSIATISSSGVLSGIATGTTNITYAIGGGCLAMQSVAVGVLAPITGVSDMCSGNITTLSDATLGGTWSSSNTSVATIDPSSGLFSGVSFGTSVITYAISTGCFSTVTASIIPTPSPITGITTICDGSSTTLSDSPPASPWTTGAGWYTGSPGIATVNFVSGVVTGITTGTAIITYIGNYPLGVVGCFTTTSVTVIPTPPAITGPTNVCTGSTIILSDAATGGSWSSSNTTAATIILSGTGSGTVSGIAAGTTIITYTTAGGCFITTTVTVIQQPSAITGITQVCTGSATTLSDAVTGGTWISTSPVIATVAPVSGIVTGVTAGTDIITYTTGSTCIATIVIAVNQSPHTIAGYTNACTGAATTLNDSSPGGTWSSGSPGIATVSGTGVVSGVAAGTAMITYTLAGDCFTTTTVTVYTSPAAITGITSVCTGLTIRLSDAVTGGTWSSGNLSRATINSGAGVLSGVTAGTVIITYTTGGNCIATTTVTVKQTPTVTTGSPNICTDGTTLLTFSPAGGTWSSSNPAAATIHIGTGSDTVAGEFSGNTVITYTLAGCLASTTVTVVAFLPGITGPSQVCTGQAILLTNTVIGGTWSSTNNAIATVDPSSGIVVGVSPGDTVISYTIGGSCITTSTLQVNLSPDPGLITGPSNLCVGTTIILSDTASGGVWSISNGNATLSGDTVTGVLPGMDTVSYTASSLFCGTAATTAAVTVTTPPYAGTITGDTIVCFGRSVTLSDGAPGGTWISSDNAIATVSGGVVSAVAIGTATISYSVTNACNTAIATYTITVYPLPAISPITGQDSVCPGAVFLLSDATAGGVWSATNTTVLSVNDTGKVKALTAGASVISYTTGPNAGSCISVKTFTVTVTSHGAYTVSGMVTPVTCNGADNGSITVTVSSDSSQIKYAWSNGNSHSFITNLAPGPYTVTVTDTVTKCAVTNMFNITQPDTLEITATPENDTCAAGNGSINITVTGGTVPYTYLWSDGKTTKDITGLLAGTYSVTVTDSNGCTKSITAIVNEDTCYKIIIHNALTPNGDGINDTWVIEGIGLYPGNSVQVFDKWGDMVYEKTNYNNDWNGKGKSGELPDGTYYYLVKLNTKNLQGGQNLWTGYLMIKR